MRIVPDSTINLYSNVQIDSGEQLVFSSVANQLAYFQAALAVQQVPCTVVRKTGRLRVEVSGAVISNCNYLSFVNPHFDDKIVYARIIDYDYINNECVEIAYAIDYWQTWMFDVQFDEMYIEREHLSQTQALIAEGNPYDPSLVELRTAENLPISSDIEKPAYEITDDNSGDGAFIGEAIASATSVSADTIGAFILLADIDFEDLDSKTPAGQTKPSDRFATVLTTIITDDFGYYELPIDTYEYLHNLYPSRVASKIGKGSGWNNFTVDGTSYGNLTPNNSTLNMPCIKLYCQNMNAPSVGVGPLERLLFVLTTYGQIEQIISMYAIPNYIFLLSAHTNQGIFYAELSTANTKINPRNPKLKLYPYSYLRLITPNGDIKELRYEDFIDVQTGDSDLCRIDMSLDFNCTPTLTLAPDRYKISGMTPAFDNMEANVYEGVVFSQFATVPYNVDGWTAQLAALSNSIIGNNTLDYGYDIMQKQLNLYEEGFNQAETIGTGIFDELKGDFGSALKKAKNALFGGAQLDIDVGRTQNEFAQSEDAYKLLSGETDNAVYKNFQYTRPAYAGKIYHQSNGDGMINYNDLWTFDFIYMRTGLNPDILDRYDKYFDMYGYNSGRCGIPHVISYVQGSSDPDELPDWHTISATMEDTTYIKTMDCKIKYSMIPVANFIKSMFDNGVRMIKGD